MPRAGNDQADIQALPLPSTARARTSVRGQIFKVLARATPREVAFQKVARSWHALSARQQRHERWRRAACPRDERRDVATPMIGGVR